ncbi:MAG: hypothetical protein ACRDZ4_11585 [Egibacteraceae bacterium]
MTESLELGDELAGATFGVEALDEVAAAEVVVLDLAADDVVGRDQTE